MRVKLTQHVTNGTSRLLVFRRRLKSKLRHSVDNTTLDWLHAVTNVRQRTVQYHVH